MMGQPVSELFELIERTDLDALQSNIEKVQSLFERLDARGVTWDDLEAVANGKKIIADAGTP